MKRKARILIVEDDLRLAFLMVHVLTRVGCDVEMATTGKKAIEKAAEKAFDLITLDIGLPDVSGLDVCSRLKERHISRKTPIIIISAKPDHEDIQEGVRRGAVDYITKPFDVTDLIYRVIFHAKIKSDRPTSLGIKRVTA
jgi:DNA-binding response OmpR family regulator